jgi:hypothetical protein
MSRSTTDIEQSELLVGTYSCQIKKGNCLIRYEAIEGMGHKFEKQPEVEMETMYEFMMQHVG